MSNNLTKISLAMMLAGMIAGCDKQEVPVATVPAPMEAAETQAAAAAPAPGPLAVTEYDASLAPAAGGNCALDAINGSSVAGATVKVGSETMFGGWIADAANQVPGNAQLVFKGAEKSYSVPLVAGVERPDVATALSADTLTLSGYAVLTKLDLLPDTYELSIIHGDAGTEASCLLNVSVIITN